MTVRETAIPEDQLKSTLNLDNIPAAHTQILILFNPAISYALISTKVIRSAKFYCMTYRNCNLEKKKTMRAFMLVSLLGLSALAWGQQNMQFSNPEIATILGGNYDPAQYSTNAPVESPEEIAAYINAMVSTDSLLSYLQAMNVFETRNTGSDTLSPARGIGAAREWVLSKFNSFNQSGTLVNGFFRFDQDVCGMGRHKNVLAIRPGVGGAQTGIVIIEAHMDSRCAEVCDIDCTAQGMEDNGSGTALVIELARIISSLNLPNTLVFMATTGEEQGLVGANAFAEYCATNSIPIMAVLNNDIVGGITCGETSSPPSCPGLNDIDSTQVRLFSFGGFNSPHKSLSRYIKLQYTEMLRPIVSVPMLLTIMTAEDRTGRGGDHIPFRERGYPAMRFTSANEHGSAMISEDYHDRQHTSDDLLGVDTDGDMVIDSFFVDFNYLSRNAVINGMAASMIARSPEVPAISDTYFDSELFYIEIDDPRDYLEYRIGVRTSAHDFDSIYVLSGTKSGLFRTAEREISIFLSVASVDSTGVESLFSDELFQRITGVEETPAEKPDNIILFQNRPNPFDEATTISFWVENPFDYRDAFLQLSDLNGKSLQKIPVGITQGMNDIVYTHGYGAEGIIVYTLVVDGRIVDSKQMIFAY